MKVTEADERAYRREGYVSIAWKLALLLFFAGLVVIGQRLSYANEVARLRKEVRVQESRLRALGYPLTFGEYLALAAGSPSPRADAELMALADWGRTETTTRVIGPAALQAVRDLIASATTKNDAILVPDFSSSTVRAAAWQRVGDWLLKDAEAARQAGNRERFEATLTAVRDLGRLTYAVGEVGVPATVDHLEAEIANSLIRDLTISPTPRSRAFARRALESRPKRPTVPKLMRLEVLRTALWYGERSHLPKPPFLAPPPEFIGNDSRSRLRTGLSSLKDFADGLEVEAERDKGVSGSGHAEQPRGGIEILTSVRAALIPFQADIAWKKVEEAISPRASSGARGASRRKLES